MLKISITLPNNAQINLESEDAAVIDRILGLVLLDITRELLVGSPAANPVPARSVPSSQESPVVLLQPATSPAPAGRETAAVPAPPPPAPAPSAETVTPQTETAPSPALSLLASPPSDDVLPPDSDGMEPADGLAEAWLEADDAAEDSGDAGVAAGRDDRDGKDDLAAVKSAHNRNNGAPPVSLASRISPISPNGDPLAEAAFVDFCRAANPLGDMRRVVVAAEGASRYLGMDGVDAEELGRLFDLAAWPRAHNFVQTLRNSARSKFGWLERVPGRAGYYSVTDLGRATALGR